MKDNSLIIARLLLNVATKKELETIGGWKDRSLKNASFLDGFYKYWNQSLEVEQTEELNQVRERIVSRLNITKKISPARSITYYLTRFAAVFILLVSIAGSSIYIASKTGLLQQNNSVVITTEAGQKSKAILPDGTLVWLNAETVLEYQQKKEERRVKLLGEAYFEVTHSVDHPFFVNTGETEIKVLGTKFNVSHYPKSKITEAALLSGKITMVVNEIGKEIVLIPGEKVVYNSEQHVLSQKIDKVQNEISWKQGILYFENDPFNEMIHELERYYGVKFIYKPAAFDEIHYSGSIDNMEINKVLEFINLTIPIDYEVNNKTIELRLK